MRRLRAASPGLLAALVPLLLLAGGCPSSTPAGKPVVAATTPVLADIVREVAGPHADVRLLTQPGEPVHALTPTPELARSVAESRAVFANGLGLEPWLDGLLAASAGQRKVYVASKGVTPLMGPDGVTPDPHAWLSPLNAAIYAESARDMLIALDPDHETEYRTNADAFVDKCRGVDARIRTQIDGIAPQRRFLLTPHDSLRYFAAHYGLTSRGIAKPGAAYTAVEVDEAIRFLDVNKVLVIFSEAGHDEEPMRQLSYKTGRRVYGPLWTETLDAPGKPAGSYIGAMQENGEIISNALRK